MEGPIQRCVENWHRHLRGELPGGLDAILAEDVVFLSPIVFSQQRGKQLTKLYLNAAGATIGEGSKQSAAASMSLSTTQGCLSLDPSRSVPQQIFRRCTVRMCLAYSTAPRRPYHASWSKVKAM